MADTEEYPLLSDSSKNVHGLRSGIYGTKLGFVVVIVFVLLIASLSLTSLNYVNTKHIQQQQQEQAKEDDSTTLPQTCSATSEYFYK